MRAVPLCLALLLASGARPQARTSWRVGEGEGEGRPVPEPPAIAAIALSMKSRAIQDSRCYLMNGGAVESFFIGEDTPVGSIIGTLSVNGDPSEEQGDITLRLQERGAALAIAPGTKNLTLLRALDREERTGPSNVYVNVRCDRRRTTDPSFIIPVSVRVWDVNDNAPQWSRAEYGVLLSELSAPGSRVALGARAADADQPGPHATVHYAVLPGPHSDYFSFPNELDGTLVIKKALDYETLSNFTVRLRAADAGTPPLYNDTTLTVQVLDADDQNPKFSREHYTAVLPDDAKEGTVLSVSPEPISAADQDVAINAPLQYSATGAGARLLTVNRDTGQLAATALLLEQLGQPITVVIKATQVDNSDRYALATVTVSRSAGSAGDAAGAGGVRFRRRQYSAAVSEASAPGAVLLALHTDPPPAAPHKELQFYVSDRGFLDKFAINGAGELLLRRALDYETQQSYHYQVMVTDGITNDTASINITVENVNEWEPRFRYPQYEFQLDADGSGLRHAELLHVGELEVFDGDKADTVTLTIRGPDAEMLYVNSSGSLFVRSAALRALNSSAPHALHALLTAEDSGRPPRQTSVPVTVRVAGGAGGAGGAVGAGRGAGLAGALPLLGGALLACALLVCALLLYICTVRKRTKQSASNTNKCSGYVTHEKPRSPPAVTVAAASADAAAAATAGVLRPAASSGSLLSVSAGASTILADSSSSLDLRNDTLPPATQSGGGAGRQSQRASRGKVAPAPAPAAAPGPREAGAALLSDHLRGPAGSRSGVAWPSDTIPARVKRIGWDNDREDSVPESAGTVAADGSIRDHTNLTVYF